MKNLIKVNQKMKIYKIKKIMHFHYQELISRLKTIINIREEQRIKAFPLKSAYYSTAILNKPIRKFNKSNMNALLQYYTEFMQRQLPNNTNTYLHVHLYEHITFRFGQSQFSNCSIYKRMKKSFLYYEHRHSTYMVFVCFELDVQDFNTYLQILEIFKESPSLSYLKNNLSPTEFNLIWINSQQYSLNQKISLHININSCLNLLIILIKVISIFINGILFIKLQSKLINFILELIIITIRNQCQNKDLLQQVMNQ